MDYRVLQRDHLLNISRALTEQLDLTEVLRRVLSAAATMLSGEIALIILRDDYEELYIAAAFGVEDEQLEIFDELLEDLQSIGVNAERIGARMRQIARKVDRPLRQYVALPLQMSNEPMGLLLVFRSFSGTPTLNDRQILQSFADQAAIAVHNARLYAAAQSERRRLSAILEHSADGIMIMDEERHILRFNRALSQMTGWQADQAIGRLDSDIIRWVRREPGPDLDELLAAGWKSERTLYMEGDIERLDGLTLSVGITYALLAREVTDAPANIIANVRDITHFRRAEEMKNTFISVVSHELKTPVALIKGYAGTMRREDAHWDEAAYQEALEVIEEEADRLTGLIENLLAASKLLAEGMRLSLDDVDIVGLATRSAERFRTQTQKHTLVLDFPPNFPLIRGDEIRLRQVFDNLISNAIKYSPNGGTIRIHGEADAQEVRIAVQDSGVGLRPDQLEHVFDRFYRADNALTRATQGAGLGLYLSRAVVEAHGGRIWAESQPGQGATFIFSLPRPHPSLSDDDIDPGQVIIDVS
jgi:PAS domain S-box-containing protein